MRGTVIRVKPCSSSTPGRTPTRSRTGKKGSMVIIVPIIEVVIREIRINNHFIPFLVLNNAEKLITVVLPERMSAYLLTPFLNALRKGVKMSAVVTSVFLAICSARAIRQFQQQVIPNRALQDSVSFLALQYLYSSAFRAIPFLPISMR